MKVLKLKELENPETSKEIEEAVKKGEIIIHPTDTVYGIGCNVENEANVKRIYESLKRKISKRN